MESFRECELFSQMSLFLLKYKIPGGACYSEQALFYYNISFLLFVSAKKAVCKIHVTREDGITNELLKKSDLVWKLLSVVKPTLNMHYQCNNVCYFSNLIDEHSFHELW
jgi:hypothetical protein